MTLDLEKEAKAVRKRMLYDFIVIFLLIVLIAYMAVTYHSVKAKGGQCILNPLSYAEKVLIEEQTKALGTSNVPEYQCTCRESGFGFANVSRLG